MARKVSTNPGDVSFSKSIDSRLKVYGIAAAAASVGLLALAEPAQAEIVITNKNIPIPRCLGLHTCPVKVDLNHDGISDFSLTVGYYGYGQNINAQIGIEPLTGGGVIGGGFESSASALVRGAKIGPTGKFLNFSVKLERSSYCTTNSACFKDHNHNGDWGGNQPNRFLGVKFLIAGKTHYGWIRVTVKTSKTAPMTAEITEYGYETIANKSCGAGLPGSDAAASDGLKEQTSGPSASLGMLAIGAEALPMWRREDLVLAGSRSCDLTGIAEMTSPRFLFLQCRGGVSLALDGFVQREIPRPAGESAGLRNDAELTRFLPSAFSGYERCPVLTADGKLDCSPK